MTYYEAEDILHVIISDGPEAAGVEASPNITAELDAHGGLIAIEILQASRFVRDTIIETVQGRLLDLPRRQSA